MESSNFTLSPVENTFQKTAAEKYKTDVSTKNPLKDPTSSTKNPAPTVPIIAAKVPAVFDIPIHKEYVIQLAHWNSINNNMNTDWAANTTCNFLQYKLPSLETMHVRTYQNPKWYTNTSAIPHKLGQLTFK